MPTESIEIPMTIWEAKNNLNYREPVSPNNPKFVNIESARGDYQLQSKLYDELSFDEECNLHQPPKMKHILFTGHIGCGKSTELRRISQHLHKPNAYFVVHLDCLTRLDTNNLKYSDVLLGLACALLEQIEKEPIDIDKVHLTNLENWFKEHVITHDKLQGVKSELTAGASIEPTIPFFAKLFASLTNKVHIGASYREEVREVVRNTSTELIDIFNKLTTVVEEQLTANNLGRRIVFTIDGTDRLDKEDSTRFFIDDINQLTQIQGIFIYCAPIHLLHEQASLLHARFDQIVRLPMLKVRNKNNHKLVENYPIIREMVYKRIAKHLFDNESTLDYLIEYSGGHMRDLLRLLNYACNRRENNIIAINSAKQAVSDIAKEYKRMLKHEHYQLLVEIDNNPDEPDEYTNELSNFMLYHLILLEYNDYFWKSHPVITTLSGYKKVSGVTDS